MHALKKASFGAVLLAVLIGGSALPALAATTPTLGVAATFGVLASTFTRNVGATAITGNLGYTTLSGGGTHTVSGTTHVADGTYSTAGTDQGSALTLLNAQACDFSFGSPTDLSLLSQPLGPGVYCIAAAASIGTGGITLNGAGTYIFRVAGALTSVANSVVSLSGGASACDVFWTPTSATTLAANTTFAGTVIDDAGITVGNTSTWSGRALAFGGTVTIDTSSVAVPTCAAPPTPSGGTASYRVIKKVVNTNGGTAIAANFTVHVRNTQNSGFDVVNAPEVSGSPASGKEAPGTLYTLPQGTYTVREDVNPAYSVSYSGDCDAAGNIALQAGANATCTITNTFIAALPPPIIDVVKVPSPLSLPLGPGQVTYTYTVTNLGIVAMSNVTLAGDTCSPIVRVSGDTDGDNMLDVTETWTHTCTTNLTATHTNTVIATGQANGFTAKHTAQATVIVGAPLVPPLVHVVKVPDPLTLFAGGGAVTYRYTVTNPGTVALSDVSITDDKCTGLPSRVTGHPGDLNKNDLLEPSERWSFTCNSNLTATTTNAATVTGHANGFTVTDIAYATVVVAPPPPVLPKTGIGPDGAAPWKAILPAGALAALALYYALRRKRVM